MLQKRFRLTTDRGAFVLREGVAPDRPAVVPGSAAEQAGIREADIIVAVNGNAIDEKTGIEDVLEKVPLGVKIPVKILREGKEQVLTLTAEERVV